MIVEPVLVLLATKTKVRLVRQYMLKFKYESDKVSEHIISHGLWETCGLDLDEEKNTEVFTLKCVMPMHEKRKVGDTIKMYSGVIAVLCDEIKFVRKDITPKEFKKNKK